MPTDNRLRNFFRQLVTGVSRNLQRSSRGRAVPEDQAATLLARYMPKFEADVRLYTQNLIEGRWQPKQWRDNVEIAIRNLYLTAAIAGAGHVARLMPDVLHDVTERLASQRPFLNKFAAEVERMEPSERNLDRLVNRLTRYGQPALTLVHAGIDRTYGRPSLPFRPKDGTTICMNGCKCDWVWEDVNADGGDWDVRWTLDRSGGVEHCATCLTRAVAFNPLKIRGGVIITNVNVPGVRARR